MNTCDFLIGLNIAIIGGGLAAWAFSYFSPIIFNLPEKPQSSVKRFPAWVTGVVERSFFFCFVITEAEGILSAMIGWLALKLAINWQKLDPNAYPEAQTRGFIALLSGAISLAFSYIGGLISVGT